MGSRKPGGSTSLGPTVTTSASCELSSGDEDDDSELLEVDDDELDVDELELLELELLEL